MNHTPDFFDKTFPREIYRQMLETGNSKNLIQTLVDMQTAHGISTEQAQQTAQICLAAVASCEGIPEHCWTSFWRVQMPRQMRTGRCCSTSSILD